MSFDLINYTVVMVAKVPEWCEENVDFKPNRSTVFRWTTRGAKGRKLRTFNAGGRKGTTVEWLMEFFGSDDQADTEKVPRSSADAESYLASEGI